MVKCWQHVCTTMNYSEEVHSNLILILHWTFPDNNNGSNLNKLISPLSCHFEWFWKWPKCNGNELRDQSDWAVSSEQWSVLRSNGVEAAERQQNNTRTLLFSLRSSMLHSRIGWRVAFKCNHGGDKRTSRRKIFTHGKLQNVPFLPFILLFDTAKNSYFFGSLALLFLFWIMNLRKSTRKPGNNPFFMAYSACIILPQRTIFICMIRLHFHHGLQYFPLMCTAIHPYRFRSYLFNLQFPFETLKRKQLIHAKKYFKRFLLFLFTSAAFIVDSRLLRQR